jgi:cell shape-determining protein MreC
MILKLLLPVAAIVFSVPLSVPTDEVAVPLPMEREALENERYLEFHIHLDESVNEEEHLKELNIQLEETMEELADLDQMMEELQQERMRLLEEMVDLQRELSGEEMYYFRPAPVAPRGELDHEAWPYRPR